MWCADIKAGGAISQICCMQYRGLSLRGRPVTYCGSWGSLLAVVIQSAGIHGSCHQHAHSNPQILQSCVCIPLADCALRRTILQTWQNSRGCAIGLSSVVSTPNTDLKLSQYSEHLYLVFNDFVIADLPQM